MPAKEYLGPASIDYKELSEASEQHEVPSLDRAQKGTSFTIIPEVPAVGLVLRFLRLRYTLFARM